MMPTQTLDQPLLDTPMVDGALADQPLKQAGMDGQRQDVAVVNTQVYDQPLPATPEATPVVVPIA
jgi:hypothetical protein